MGRRLSLSRRDIPKVRRQSGYPVRMSRLGNILEVQRQGQPAGGRRGTRIAAPPRTLGRLSGTRYGDLIAEFGSRFVAQLAIGVAGSGTAIIDSAEDWMDAAKRFGDAPVWIAPNAGPLSFNVNAVATRCGTAVGYPSVQIVGRALLNSHRAGYCGNDFSATAETPRAIVESIREQTTRIGDWMASQDCLGIFGLDFVVDDATLKACVVDLNPRWQGSTAMQNQAERRQGRVPLAAFELAMQLGLAGDDELMRHADSFFEPLEGSQLFPKNLRPATGGPEARWPPAFTPRGCNSSVPRCGCTNSRRKANAC